MNCICISKQTLIICNITTVKIKFLNLNNKTLLLIHVFYMGTDQKCRKKLLHEGTLLYEENFAQRDIFAGITFERRVIFAQKVILHESK